MDDISFEDTSKIKEYIKLDTSNGNIWRIGKPAKLKFNKASSLDNAIVTGLKGYYPPNTKSSFILKFFASNDVPKDNKYKISFVGLFKIDSDTINDFGLIEMSPNNGLDWLDITHEHWGTWYYQGTNNAPIFSGNLTDGWHNFVFFTDSYWGYSSTDTLRFRFTFVSDSIDTHKEGWMIDDLKIYIWPPVSVNDQVQKINQIIITPNPVYKINNFTISLNNIDAAFARIYDSQGKLHDQYNNPGNVVEINSGQLLQGIYIIEVLDKKGNKYLKKLSIN